MAMTLANLVGISGAAARSHQTANQRALLAASRPAMPAPAAWFRHSQLRRNVYARTNDDVVWFALTSMARQPEPASNRSVIQLQTFSFRLPPLLSKDSHGLAEPSGLPLPFFVRI